MIRAVVYVIYLYDERFNSSDTIIFEVKERQDIAHYVHDYAMEAINERYKKNPERLIIDYEYCIESITELEDD
jgi:hypothetical protein